MSIVVEPVLFNFKRVSTRTFYVEVHEQITYIIRLDFFCSCPLCFFPYLRLSLIKQSNTNEDFSNHIHRIPNNDRQTIANFAPYRPPARRSDAIRLEKVPLNNSDRII